MSDSFGLNVPSKHWLTKRTMPDLRHPLRPAARATRGPRQHHPLARQVLGEGRTRRLAADEPLHLAVCRTLGSDSDYERFGCRLPAVRSRLDETARMGLGRSLERRIPALVGLCRPIRIEKSGVVKRVSSPPIGALTDCFSSIRGGQSSALNNTLCGGISAISAWHRPLVAFDPKYPTRRSHHTRAQPIDARFYGVKRRSTTCR